MRRVEQFELIRKDNEAGLSIREIVRKRGVHRRTVRQALRSAFNRGVSHDQPGNSPLIRCHSG